MTQLKDGCQRTVLRALCLSLVAPFAANGGDDAKLPGLGLRGYEDFVSPVSMPTLFEDPFIRNSLRVLYMYHTIPDDSVLRGGQMHVAGVGFTIALSDRLALIGTKDGYSWVDTHISAAGDGWNDIAVGLKYALDSDPAEKKLLSIGLRWELNNGSTDAFQGGDSHEINPFISYAKGWEKWHFLAALNGRIPTNRTNANASVHWGLHFDYKLTETFRPLIEFNGIHWITNAERLPLSTDYLDVGSLGAADAAGRDFFSVALGFRWQARDDVSVGFTYEMPLESPSEHLMQHRFTFNAVIEF